MEFELRSLNGRYKMPLPDRPEVSRYGGEYARGAGHDIRLFPAVIKPAKATQVDPILTDGQSSCFFHPQIAATAVCEVSGRFICNVCRKEWNGQTISHTTFQEMRRKGVVERNKKRVIWDDISCSIAVLPLLFWPITLISAPVAVGIAATNWRKGPTSILRRSRWRYVLAIVIALLQIAGWIAFFVFLFKAL